MAARLTYRWLARLSISSIKVRFRLVSSKFASFLFKLSSNTSSLALKSDVHTPFALTTHRDQHKQDPRNRHVREELPMFLVPAVLLQADPLSSRHGHVLRARESCRRSVDMDSVELIQVFIVDRDPRWVSTKHLYLTRAMSVRGCINLHVLV
mmetsp:Transcript_40905/g.128811  ORF Transcript_40905/g.128811 Transcript_40905/m.128811 type:complete len:152 (-) Transcript_40905:29-484(-)